MIHNWLKNLSKVSGTFSPVEICGTIRWLLHWFLLLNFGKRAINLGSSTNDSSSSKMNWWDQTPPDTTVIGNWKQKHFHFHSSEMQLKGDFLTIVPEMEYACIVSCSFHFLVFPLSTLDAPTCTKKTMQIIELDMKICSIRMFFVCAPRFTVTHLHFSIQVKYSKKKKVLFWRVVMQGAIL